MLGGILGFGVVLAHLAGAQEASIPWDQLVEQSDCVIHARVSNVRYGKPESKSILKIEQVLKGSYLGPSRALRRNILSKGDWRAADNTFIWTWRTSDPVDQQFLNHG